MARRDPPQPRRRVVVAAGWRVRPSNRDDLTRLSTNRVGGFQDAAWGYYDTIAELRYATDLVADLVSRCQIRVGWFPVPFIPELLPEETPVVLDENDQEVGPLPEWPLATTVAAAEDALARVLDGMGGPTELLKPLGIHMQIPGESWICAWQDPGDPANGVAAREVWRVVDRSLLDTTHEQLRVKDSAKDPRGNAIGDDGYAVRVWRPHPRNRDNSTTHVESMLDDLEQLGLLRRQARQSHRTMLTNGILLVNNQVDFAANDADVLTETTAGSVLGIEMGLEPVDLGDLILDRIRTATANEAAPETVVPIVVPVTPAADGSLDGIMKLVTFDRRVDADELAEREQLVLAIARGLPLPPEVVLGLGDSNHWCKDQLTEVLSQDRGWIRHDQLEVGDRVWTLNHATGLGEWQPVEAIYRADVVDEPMLSMESASHSSLSTAGHRWPVVKAGRKVAGSRRRWTTSRDGFTSTDRVPVAARAVDAPLEPKYADDYVRLVAAWTADGTVLHYESGTEYARIAKFDQAEIDEVRRVVRSVFGDVGWREHPHRTRTVDGTAFVFGYQQTAVLREATGDHKAVTLEFVDALTLAQRGLLLEAMLDLGDGVRHDSADIYFQVEPSRLDALEVAAVTLGRKVTRGVRNQQTGWGDRPLSWLRVSASRTTFSPWDCERAWVPYTGTVWCPTTGNGTWFARRNGTVYFTGNSAWAITEERFQSAIAPLAGLVMNALTEHVLRPLLRVAGVPEGEVRKVCWWYDPTEVIQRPDPTPVVQAAHAAGVVSDQFMRQFVPGATDADRPDVIEYLTRGMREAQWTPEMVAQAFQFLNNGRALFELTALSDPSMGGGGPPPPSEPEPAPNSPPSLPASSGPPPFPPRRHAHR